MKKTNSKELLQNKMSKIAQLKSKKYIQNTDNNSFRTFILSQTIVNNIKTKYKTSFSKPIKNFNNIIQRNLSEYNKNKKEYSKSKIKEFLKDTNIFQNHSSLVTTTSTNYFNRKIFNSKSLNTISSFREKNFRENKNELMEKIKEKQERMIKMKKINMMMNSNINKKKDILNKMEMKLIKVKLHKILKKIKMN